MVHFSVCKLPSAVVEAVQDFVRGLGLSFEVRDLVIDTGSACLVLEGDGRSTSVPDQAAQALLSRCYAAGMQIPD